LDANVNEQRDGFDLPKKASDREQTFAILGADVSLNEIYETIEETVTQMLTPPDWKKEVLIEKIGKKYGISSSMILETDTRIRYGDTEESVVKRVLNKYTDKIISDTSEIFDIQNEIKNLEP